MRQAQAAEDKRQKHEELTAAKLKRGIIAIQTDRQGHTKVVRKQLRRGAFSPQDELNMCLLDEHICDMYTRCVCAQLCSTHFLEFRAQLWM